jgi:hypothetical protein
VVGICKASDSVKATINRDLCTKTVGLPTSVKPKCSSR